ncbi:MAG: portal protein [Planctomycetaceae bacterium]|nr:portal protein [Planctomycetaceae bacterium]
MSSATEQIGTNNGVYRRDLPVRPEEYRGTKPYRRRWTQLERLAQPYLPVWRILNEYMHPWSGRYLWSEKDRNEIIRGYNIVNGVVGDAARTCSSGLHGGLTSPSKPWFEVTHPDSEMMEVGPVKQWMHVVQEIMRDTLRRSNFYSVMPNLYHEAVIYGTAAALIDQDGETGVRLRHLTIGEYFLAVGEDLRVNTLDRRRDMTAAQMREKFGKDNPGYNTAVREALRTGNLDDATFTIIHAIQPAGDTMFGGKMREGFPYESVYFMQATERPDEDRQAILQYQMHRSSPFVAVRWSSVSDDVYGFSPGMMALSDNRMLQSMERDYINAAEMAIKPMLTGPSSLEWDFKVRSMQPGLYVPHNDLGSSPGIRPLYQVDFDFNNTRVKIQDTVQQIQNKFYNNLFLSILFNTKQMTATEVAQRLEEKAMVLGPVLERFQSELFDPILNRVFSLLFYERGVIPTPPEEIAGNNLKIDYIGSLAQSVRLQGITNITNVLPILLELLKIDPSAAKKLNVREIIDEVTKSANFSPKMVRTDEECAQLDAQEAEQRQQEAAAQQAVQMAQAAKTASETSLANGSMLTGAEGGITEAEGERYGFNAA